MPAEVARAELQRTADVLARCSGHQPSAARELGIKQQGVSRRLEMIRRAGIKPSAGVEDPENLAHVKQQLKRAERELVQARERDLTHETIRRRIIGLKSSPEILSPPAFLAPTRSDPSAPGVPTLMVSDLHWGEKVHSSQINGVNSYDLKTAHRRMDDLASASVHLLKILDPKMRYPGIVIPLGGDMISGNIHDELAVSNEMNTMPTVLDLFGKLAPFIRFMADTFGKVFLPCVTGNHGRDTHKIYAKDRHHTSFDWLLYCFLARHFEGDKRITFFIPDGPDAYYKVYGHRYLLTHGDQFRGGDGVIGALGPIIRGDHRKRSRNSQIDMEYDTMLIGHWHQYIHLNRLIVNGSLKGYDEYAYGGNFPFEAPQQALFVTHPRYGITYRMPVLVDRPRHALKTSWVSVPA